MKGNRNRKRGVVIVMLALGAPFFFGLAGLAVDTIFVYSVKARLVTAVDACALAAARSIGKGQSEMNRIVDLMFDSNFPEDMLLAVDRGHTVPQIDVFPTEGRREVSLTGHVVVPTIFMRLFGWDSLRIEADARATRRDVDVVLVLDRSGSMVLAPGPPWPELQDAAKFFVDQFDTTSDRMALVTFGTSARVDYSLNYSPGVDFKTPIKNDIDNHQSYSANRTNTSLGLYYAYKELLDYGDPNALSAIVFFTDGQPTAFANYFDVETCGSDPCSNVSPKPGVVYTQQTLSNIWGLAHPVAAGVPANEGGSNDIRRIPGTQGNLSAVETLLQPTLAANGGSGLRHFRPEGPTSLPEFRLDQGPNAGQIDMTGQTLISGTSVQRGTQVMLIAEDVSLEVAKEARNPALLNGGIRIYGIGLGGYLGPANDNFMKNLANTPDSPIHYDDQPEGIYYYAPGPAQLRQAFQTVASEIFRLIQ